MAHAQYYYKNRIKNQKSITAHTYINIALYLYIHIPSHTVLLNWITAYNSIIGVPRPERYRRKYNHIFIILIVKKRNRKEVSIITLIFEDKDSYGAPADITVDISGTRMIRPSWLRERPRLRNSIHALLRGRSCITWILKLKEHPVYMINPDVDRCHIRQQMAKACCLIL